MIQVGAIEVESNSHTIPLPIVFEVFFGVDVCIGPINNSLSAALDDGALESIVAPVRNLRRFQLLHIADHLRLSAEYALIVLGANQKEQLRVIFAHE